MNLFPVLTINLEVKTTFFRGVQKLEQGGGRAALMGAVQVETVEPVQVEAVEIVETVQEEIVEDGSFQLSIYSFQLSVFNFQAAAC